MSASPCFAMCGKPACQRLGCVRVYNARHEHLPGSAAPSEREVRGWTPAPVKVYVVFSYGDPMPITVCATSDLAEQYAAALARLPEDHPLHTKDAVVDEVPLNRELPEPLRNPEEQTWPMG